MNPVVGAALLAFGCRDDTIDLRLSLADVPTVVRGGWSVAAEEAALAWSLDGETWVQVDGRSQAGEWDAVAVGLKPSTDYQFRVIVDGEPSATTTFSTGYGPDIPETTVTWGDDPVAEGFLAVGLIGAQSRAAIIDRDGDVVWWMDSPDPGMLVTRVRPAPDGRGVRFDTHLEGENGDDLGHIYEVAWTGELLEDIEAPSLHHDWAEAPDGTIAWLSHERVTWEEAPTLVDVVVERAPDGTERRLWSALDWYDPADFLEAQEGTTFVHANTLVYDDATDDWWVGLRNASQIVRVDRGTGDLVERLLGDDGDYEVVGTPMSWQHGFSRTADGLVIHDNRSEDDEFTRVVEYAFDGDRLVETWTYTSSHHVFGLGDALRLENGNTLAVWGVAGEAAEITPDGREAWRLNFGVGAALGYATWWTGL